VREFFLRFGIPLEIHTDQGRNFDCDLMRRLGQLLGWAKTRTTPYHPSSNGLVERFNRTLLQMMRCFVSQSQDNWDEHLHLLTGAYRSTPHTSTGLTPNRLMLGREVHLPQELIFGLQEKTSCDYEDYIDKLSLSLQRCHNFAREFLKRSSENQKRLHDLRKNERTFETGDLVYVMDSAKKIGRSPKLQAQWKGPYIVNKRLSNVLYEVSNQKTTSILHHDRLKPAVLETTPLWISRHRRKLKNEETDMHIIQELSQEELNAEAEDSELTGMTTGGPSGSRTHVPDPDGLVDNDQKPAQTVEMESNASFDAIQDVPSPSPTIGQEVIGSSESRTQVPDSGVTTNQQPLTTRRDDKAHDVIRGPVASGTNSHSSEEPITTRCGRNVTKQARFRDGV